MLYTDLKEPMGTVEVGPTLGNRSPFKKLTVCQLDIKFPALCGSRRNVAVFPRARHHFLS